MTDPTISPHKPPVIEDDSDTAREMYAENERLRELLIIARDYIACDVRNRQYTWAVEIFDKINAALIAGKSEP